MTHTVSFTFSYQGVAYATGHQRINLGPNNKVRNVEQENDLKFSMYRRLDSIAALLEQHRKLDKCTAIDLIEDFKITIRI